MAKWAVAGEWWADQTNGYRVNFRVSPVRVDGTFDARASHSDGAVFGHGTGSTHDDQFLVVIAWANGSKGVYTGLFQADGNLGGATYDYNNPDSRAGWSAGPFQRE